MDLHAVIESLFEIAVTEIDDIEELKGEKLDAFRQRVGIDWDTDIFFNKFCVITCYPEDMEKVKNFVGAPSSIALHSSLYNTHIDFFDYNKNEFLMDLLVGTEPDEEIEPIKDGE